jgi:hypothetical protein
MRLAVVIIIASVALAHADDVDVDVEGRAATDLRGDALVWENATLYFEPWEGGVRVNFPSFLDRYANVGRAYPVKIVSASLENFVEIVPVQDSSCTWRRVTIDPRLAGVRLYVKRSDLAPVLVKPYVKKYANGTSVRLQPGVPVMPTVDGDYLVSARGDIVRLPIPHSSVAFTFKRSRIATRPEMGAWQFERPQTAVLGQQDVDLHAPWQMTMGAAAGDRVDVTLAAKCMELVVEVPVKSLRKASSDRPLHQLFPRDRSVAREHRVRAGTPLSTFGGREVAVANELIEVEAPHEGRACFESHVDLVQLEYAYEDHYYRQPVRLCAYAPTVEGPAVDQRVAKADPFAPPADVIKPPEDAMRTPHGVLYKRLAVGKGTRKPTPDSTVVVHYTGWTTDGKMFDSSLKSGQPARFNLHAVIAGWIDGMQVMTIGDKVRFWIPEDLAYKGAASAPQGMLVFDIELIAIE